MRLRFQTLHRPTTSLTLRVATTLLLASEFIALPSPAQIAAKICAASKITADAKPIRSIAASKSEPSLEGRLLAESRTNIWNFDAIINNSANYLAASSPAIRLLSEVIELDLLARGQMKAVAKSAAPASSTSNAKRLASEDNGERLFQANCNRCHNAPQALPRSISGTVMRHMRVRASLSAEDERVILKYIAP